jgi:hypothetical protein
MWAFVTKGVALYKIAKSRGHEVPLEVLGENPNGIDVHPKLPNFLGARSDFTLQ